MNFCIRDVSGDVSIGVVFDVYKKTYIRSYHLLL